MAKMISKLDGVKILHYPRFYDDEVFCEFEFGGYKFEMTEPYGDSSVYDVVAPKPNLSEMHEVAEHFESTNAVKGGDFAQNVYFLCSWVISSAVLIGLVVGIWRGVKWLAS